MSFLFLGRSDSFLYILVFIMRMLKFLVRYFFSFLGLSLWFVLCFCLFIFFFFVFDFFVWIEDDVVFVGGFINDYFFESGVFEFYVFILD